MLKFARYHQRSSSVDRSPGCKVEEGTPRRGGSLERAPPPPRRRLSESPPYLPPRRKSPCEESPPPELPPKNLGEKKSYRVLSSGGLCRESRNSGCCGSGRSALKKKYDFQRAVESLVDKLDLNLDNVSEHESGYGSDIDSASVLNPSSSANNRIPPLPPRKKSLKKRVRFDSYVLLLEALRERDSSSARFLLDRVNPEALLTEEITLEFIRTLVSGEDPALTEELLRHGANANAVEPASGLSVLHLASSKNNLFAIKLLLNCGAAVFAQAPSTGKIPSECLDRRLPGFQACLAYLRCMEECLGVANDGVVYATRPYRTSRNDELPLTENGQSVKVLRRGDYPGSTWWWCRNSEEREGYVLQDIISLNKSIHGGGEVS